jgi:hypothetical protein
VTRLRVIGLLTLATAAGALGTAAPASAALDGTTTTVACSPSSDATGAASTCTATVTDTEPTPQGTPTGQVKFTAAPSSGTFSGGGACTIPVSATGETVSCHLTFTPSAGGGYTISGAYSGDTTHSASAGSGALTAVDPTSTSFTCTNSTLQLDSSTECTATLSDASSPQAPAGDVTFSSSPATGTFGSPGACSWQASGSGGGSATCEVTFAPASAGGYTLSAAYSGDSSHSASTGTFGLTATTTPANGGPGSQPGTTTLTVPVSNGPPPPATLTVARNAKVSSKHRAALKLSCAGAAGTSCVGKLTLATVVKVKVKVKTKGKHSKKHQPKPQTTTKLVTTIFGSVKYDLAPGRSHTFAVKLSNKGLRLLAGARRGKLKVTAYAANFFTSNVTLLAPKHSKHKKHKKKKK